MQSWGIPLVEVAAMAAHLPSDSAAMRSVDPDHSWTLQAHLLALVADNTTRLLWTKTKAAQDHPSRWPDQIRRPGVDPDEGKEVRTFGSGPVPLDELDAFLKGGDQIVD